MSYAHASGSQDDTAVGKVILMTASAASAVLVLAALIYATGTGARHQAAMAAAGCVPSLFISGLPCTTAPMMAQAYASVATPANQQLDAEAAEYTANETTSLAAAASALHAEVTTEQAFGTSLAAMTFTPQNRANAAAQIQNATSNGTLSVPLDAVTFTPQITVIANALIQADQALATLTAEQARSSALTQMRSFNQRVQDASDAVQAEMKLLSKALGS